MRTLAILAAASALGAIATPAAAQYYPQQPTPQPYPGQPGYGYPQQGYGYPQQQGYGYPQQQGYAYPQQQGGIGAIIGQLLGGRNYAANDRMAINQCAAAATAQAARQYRPRYSQQGYGNNYGYNQPYAGQARVTAITAVERRGRNNLRVTGVLDSGMNGYAQNPYGQQGYGQQAYAQGDLGFRCTVDYRGQVTNLRLTRRR